MRRRDLLLSATAVMVARAARAQQKAMPVIGWLSSLSPAVQGGSRMSEVGMHDAGTSIAAFHGGLSDTGYFQGQNVHIEYRWAEGHFDRLPALATDLVARTWT